MNASKYKEEFNKLDPSKRLEYINNLENIEESLSLLEYLNDKEQEKFLIDNNKKLEPLFLVENDDFRVHLCKCLKGSLYGRCLVDARVLPNIQNEKKIVEALKILGSDCYIDTNVALKIKDLKLREDVISVFDSAFQKGKLILSFEKDEDIIRLVNEHIKVNDRNVVVAMMSKELSYSYLKQLPNDKIRFDVIKKLFSIKKNKHKLEDFLDTMDTDKSKLKLMFEVITNPQDRISMLKFND